MTNTRVQCLINIDPFDDQTVIITPIRMPFEDNSVYSFELKNITDTNGISIEPTKVQYVTQPKPFYVNYKEVVALAGGLELPPELVYHHIREASKYADHIARKANKGNNPYLPPIVLDKETIETDNYGYYMFIKYKAVRECILSTYIELSSNPERIKNQTSDLIYEHQFDLANLKKLLDVLDKEADDWEKELVTISASPKQTILGKYACHPYHSTGLTGYGRDF